MVGGTGLGHLLTAQSRGPAQTGSDGEAHLAGAGLGTAGVQETTQLRAACVRGVPMCHISGVTPR